MAVSWVVSDNSCDRNVHRPGLSNETSLRFAGLDKASLNSAHFPPTLLPAFRPRMHLLEYFGSANEMLWRLNCGASSTPLQAGI